MRKIPKEAVPYYRAALASAILLAAVLIVMLFMASCSKSVALSDPEPDLEADYVEFCVEVSYMSTASQDGEPISTFYNSETVVFDTPLDMAVFISNRRDTSYSFTSGDGITISEREWITPYAYPVKEVEPKEHVIDRVVSFQYDYFSGKADLTYTIKGSPVTVFGLTYNELLRVPKKLKNINTLAVSHAIKTM